MITVNGVITACTVTTASGDEREARWEFTEGVHGLVIGDKGYMSAFVKAGRTVGIDRQTPLRANRTETRTPDVVWRLTRTRRPVETGMGPLTERFHFEKIRARDRWRLTSRIAHKVLAHPLGIFVNRLLGRSDLQFDGLIA